MKEKTLKNIIFFLILTAKILTIGLILFHYATNGLEKSEAYSTIIFILPLFTVYLTVMVKDLLSDPYRSDEKPDEKPKRVKFSVSLLTFIVFPIYIISIIFSINLTAQGSIEPDGLQQIIGIIESVFGIYIGQIILSLFKQKENSEKK